MSWSVEAGLADSPAVAAARSGIAPGTDAWIVGGAVRDALLGRHVGDVDVAVAADAREHARRIASVAGGHPFELSGEFATWRVSARDASWSVDVAELRAEGIESDLAARDFTANALAMPLHGAGVAPVDPTCGAADIERRTLRAVSERSFSDDPLRLMRAARIAAALGFGIEPETVSLARSAAPLAAEPAGERQFAELAALVAGPDPIRGMELLDELGATAVVLPELDGLRGVGQSANHHLDAHGHTIEVLRRALEVEADLERYAGPSADEVAELIAGPLADGLTRRDGLRFGALLHDIAKPVTRQEHEGRVSFLGHDSVGADMVKELCGRLRTSSRFAGYLAALTRDHLVLGFMVRDRPLPPRRVLDYLRRTSPWSVDTTLLTVADRLSAKGGGVPAAAIEGHLDLAREMLVDAVRWEFEGPPAPLLRGDEIAAAAGIDPGPELGVAVHELEAAQFAGEVEDREAAEAHLRAWSDGR